MTPQDLQTASLRIDARLRELDSQRQRESPDLLREVVTLAEKMLREPSRASATNNTP